MHSELKILSLIVFYGVYLKPDPDPYRGSGCPQTDCHTLRFLYLVRAVLRSLFISTGSTLLAHLFLSAFGICFHPTLLKVLHTINVPE